MKRLRLTGAGPDLEAALDRLHVYTEVVAVAESDGSLDVMFEGQEPELSGVTIEPLATDGPEVTGLEDDRAIPVGEAILVRPPWVPAVPGFSGIELVVPRAMAFGSGEHGSTQAALCVLERMFGDAPGGGSIESVADVGTGSGILALYAQARGCGRILACDVDPDAVAAARELLPRAHVVCGGPDAIAGLADQVDRVDLVDTKVDLVIANMRGTEIDGCFEAILALWNGRGPLVLSGLRPDETAGFEQRLGGAADHRVEVGGFVALGYAPRDHAAREDAAREATAPEERP